MSRDTIWYAVVAFLGGSAIALAAATFPTASSSDGPPVPGDSEGLGTFSIPVPEDPPASSGELPSSLADLLGTLFLVTTVVGLLAAVVYATLNWRQMLGWIAQCAVISVVVFLFFYLVMRLPEDLFARGEFGLGDDPTRGGGSDIGDGSLLSTDPAPLVVVFALVGAVVLVVLAALYRRDGDSGDELTGGVADDPETATAVGRAAGRAADRIETAAAAENEIYRAWGRMVGLVDTPDPETRTTAEFADAAVDAGMEPDDVQELTRLFEDVRYGTDDPSEDAEQRAADLFRRIEATYAEES